MCANCTLLSSTGGGWITKTDLQKELKGLYPLHSQTVQAVAHKFLPARDGTKEARKKDIKKFGILGNINLFSILNGWIKLFQSEGNRLILSMGDWNGKHQPKLTLKLPKVPTGRVKEVELVYDCKWFVCLSYENGVRPSKQA